MPNIPDGIFIPDSTQTDEVTSCIAKLLSGETLSRSFFQSIYNMDPKDYNWNLFHALFFNEQEKTRNQYWTATWVATKLEIPKIKNMAMKVNDRARYRDNFDDLFQKSCILIQRCIFDYQPDKAKFPYFIKPELTGLGFRHDRDSSAYQETVRRFVTVSVNELEEESETTLDKLEYSKTTGSLEESYIAQEELDIFTTICKICKIPLSNDQITGDLSKNPKAVMDFTICKKFLGDGNDSNKQICLQEFLKQQRAERMDEDYEYAF